MSVRLETQATATGVLAGKNTMETRKMLDLPKERLEFQKKDYELKIGYLTNHFTRMWNRFNFFLVLQAGISAALWVWLKDKGGFIPQAPALACVGLVSAFVWYAFGAQDRHLVEIYRTQVRTAGEEIAGQIKLMNYVSVGREDTVIAQPWYHWLYQWRSNLFSPTKLAAWFPLLAMAYWVYMVILTASTAIPAPVGK
jgi:hypothetical protein